MKRLKEMGKTPTAAADARFRPVWSCFDLFRPQKEKSRFNPKFPCRLARQTGCNGLIGHQKIKVNQGGSSSIKVDQGILKHFYFMQNQGSAIIEVAGRSIARRTFPMVRGLLL